MRIAARLAALACSLAAAAACTGSDAGDASSHAHAGATHSPGARIRPDAIACGGSTTVAGIDVSSYDTVDDWSAVKAGGVDFAFVRVSDGTQYPDPMFASYWAGAKSANVIRGAYQFFRPAEDPIAQADLLLAATGTYQPGDLPPVLDLEVDGGLSPADVVASVQQWVDHITAAIGRPPIVYAGLYSWPELTDSADFTTSPLWLAQYTSDACPDIPTPWVSWLFWQYSATGSTAGIEGSDTLDVDVFNGTAAQLAAFAAAAPPPCATIGTDAFIIDNGDACFTDGGDPQYLREVDDDGVGGSLIWTHPTDADTESNFAQWDLSFAAAGDYTIDVYTAAPWATSTAAAYEVYTGGASTTAVIDQSAVDGWQTLGTFTFAAGGDQWVHLSDDTGEPDPSSKQLVFDAIRITAIDGGSGSGGAGSGSGGGPSADVTVGGGCSADGAGGVAGGVALVPFALGLAFARRRHRRA